MRRLFILSFCAALTACGALKQPAAVVESGQPPTTNRSRAPVRVDKVNLLLREANRLADRVQTGELTRVAAADQLNAYRLRLVGANRVDDSTFATYRYLAHERDAGTMTQEETHAHMEIKLRDWQRLWPSLKKRPADPAFTNFLLRLYNMPPLGSAAP